MLETAACYLQVATPAVLLPRVNTRLGMAGPAKSRHTNTNTNTNTNTYTSKRCGGMLLQTSPRAQAPLPCPLLVDEVWATNHRCDFSPQT